MSEQSSSSPSWDATTKQIMAVGLFGALLLLMWFVRDILALIVVSMLLAFILHPLVSFITKEIFRSSSGRGARRSLAAFLTFLFAIFVLIISVLVVVPAVVNQVEDFGSSIPRRLQSVENDLEAVLGEPITFNGEPILLDGEPLVPLERIEEATGTDDLSELLRLDALDLESAAQTFFNSAGSLTGTAFGFLGSAFNTTINTTLLLVMTFYLMKDGGIFADKLVELAPDAYHDDARQLLSELGDVWNAYVRGQLILCVAMGLAVYIAALILGVPNAPLLGLLAGLLEFIPNLGPLIALIPAAFLALISESSTIVIGGQALAGFPFALVVIIVWTGLQNVEALVLVPRIMGDSLDLHPFAVIVAVLGGAALAGALGVILAAPLLASGRVLTRYVYGKLTERYPFRQERDDDRSPRRPPWLTRLIQRSWRSARRWQRRRKLERRKRQSAETTGESTATDAQ